MIEAQAQGGAPWAAYAQRLLAPGSQLFRWPRPGGHDDKVGGQWGRVLLPACRSCGCH